MDLYYYLIILILLDRFFNEHIPFHQKIEMTANYLMDPLYQSSFNSNNWATFAHKQAVSREIRRILTERAANFNIALDDVSIINLTFGKEFTAAIEAKQVAAQEAERAKFIVEKAEQDKRSAIVRAQVCFEFFFSS